MTTHTSRIVEWDEDLGYGSLEYCGERIFLHTRNFAKLYRQPQLGDKVLFRIGLDDRNREIATGAVLLRCGGFFHYLKPTWPVLLLILPVFALAMAPLPWPSWYAIVHVAVFSAVTYAVIRHANRRSSGSYRYTPDSTLHFFELIGGWPGSLVARKLFQFPHRRARYRFAFWTIVFLWQAAAVDSLFNWRVSSSVWSGMFPVVEQMLAKV